jgi:Family of unknown function (DUF5372)
VEYRLQNGLQPPTRHLLGNAICDSWHTPSELHSLPSIWGIGERHPSLHPLRGRTFEVLKVRRLSGQEILSLRHPNLGSIAMPRDWTDWAPPGAQPPPECAPLLIDVFALVCLAEFAACLKYRDEGLDR